jgi:uncharacterized caspase-like protein
MSENGARRISQRMLRHALVLASLLILTWTSARTLAAETLKGVALVVGQKTYETLPPLANPARDAREIEGLLDRLGFKTDLATDLTGRKFRRALDGFIEDAGEADVALLYYSGHGIEAGGINYLIPVDADQSALTEADAELVSLQDVLERLRSKARITILLLDACRSNPFPPAAMLKRNAGSIGLPIAASGFAQSKGIVVLDEVKSADNIGEVVGFAAEPGRVALDGPGGGNSPYASALLKHLDANAGYDFGQVMTMVTEEVYLATGARQRPWTNLSLRRLLAFGGRPEQLAGDDALLTGERRKLLLTIAATPRDLRAAVEGLAKEQSLPLDPLYGILRELKVDVGAGPDELDQQLRAGAETLKKLLSEKVMPVRSDPELMRLAELADRAQAQGLMGLAREYSAKASARADELDRILDQREAEISVDRVELASVYAEEADRAILAFNSRLAAVKYTKAFEQIDRQDAALAFKYKLAEADALSRYGDQRAIAAYEEAIGFVSPGDDWAKAQIGLGRALWRASGSEIGTAILSRSVAAFDAALTMLPRERRPLHWASVQSDLGLALTHLGNREWGTSSLIRAISVFEAATPLLKPEITFKQWAETQARLGQALQILGERESSNKSLIRSVEVFERVAAERMRLYVWLDWSRRHDSLARALEDVREITVADIDLSRAYNIKRKAYKEALPEQRQRRTHVIRAYEDAPSNEAAASAVVSRVLEDGGSVRWSGHQRTLALIGLNNAQRDLGKALLRLGDRENGSASLRRSAFAYEAALPRGGNLRASLTSFESLSGLGAALTRLGEREKSSALLSRAVIAFDNALTQRIPARDKQRRALILAGQAGALQRLGELEDGTRSLTRAVATAEAALADLPRGRDSLEWSRAQITLADALRVIGERKSDVEVLGRAVSAYETALSEGMTERVLVEWAESRGKLGLTRLLVGRLTGQEPVSEDGRRLIESANEIFRSVGNTHLERYFQQRLVDLAPL